jgi:asparagine synthase (glutamine-hydrolysing)
MCGIAGIYNYKSFFPVEGNILLEMNDTMIYRGPDDEGIFIDEELGFAHRRLSIIDLSTAGKQPLCNEDGSIWLTFNGEIYNYLELIPELQAKGHVFKSKTDSEVIIHAYEEWGIDCLQKFNGMFAFAVWDKNKKRLFIVRDRLGVKPLYYAFNDDGIVFASEIKAVLKHPAHKSPSADRSSVYDYVNEGYLAGNRTLFKDIYKLIPGSYILVENQEVKEQTYWKLPLAPVISDVSEKEYIENFRELFIDAIKIRLRSDVPVGFHLSGGIDSSAIVSAASKNFEFDSKTFSIRFSDFPEFDEGNFIKIVQKDSNTDHKELVPDFEKDFPERLRKIVYLLDEPADGPAVLSKFELNKFVKESGITVALTGQGADEILGGYKRFLLPYIKDLKNPAVLKQFLLNTEVNQLFINGLNHSSLVSNNFSDVLCKLFKYKSSNFKNSLFSDSIKNLVSQNDFSGNFYKENYPDVFESGVSKLSAAMHYETAFYLQSLLHSEDRTSMGNSLETRTPFVDYRLVEYAAKIPSVLKLKNFSTKHILREATKGLLPEPIRTRRDKKGFPTPASVWFRTSQKDYLQGIIESKEFKDRDVFNVDSVKRLFDEHQQGRDHTFKLWFILNTEIWFREFIDG